VDATPRHLGNTYLCKFHSLIQPPGLGTGLAPYLTMASLSTEVRRELWWWHQFLIWDCVYFTRAKESATLIPTWGNGSGTGTGGTFLVDKLRPHRM
jgi:hypothetical protein